MPVVLTPDMNLPVPIVGQEPGPQYATDVNACFVILDGHTHTPGSGVFITTNALNINADLPYNGNRLTGVKSAAFNAQTNPLPAASPDLGALYVAGVDLYYNDENGNQIRITQNGGVVGSPGTITGLVPPASVSYIAGNSTFVFQSDVNTPANIDGASFIFRDLTANSFGVTVSPIPSLGTDYNLTLPLAPTVNPRVLTIDIAGNITPSGVAGTGTTEADVLPGFGLMPTGAITAYGGASAPAGYLVCDGSSLLRTTYANLFTAIGTAYGAADGTHFNLPDLRGMFARGVDSGAGNDPDTNSRTAQHAGGNTGDNVGSFQDYEIQSHDHREYSSETTGLSPGMQGSNDAVEFGPPGIATVNFTGTTGGAETRPRNLYVTYIIKT